MEQLPKSTEHVVCVHTVPLIFPSLPLSEKVMSAIEGLPVLKGAMTKTGVGAGIIDKCAPSSWSSQAGAVFSSIQCWTSEVVDKACL